MNTAIYNIDHLRRTDFVFQPPETAINSEKITVSINLDKERKAMQQNMENLAFQKQVMWRCCSNFLRMLSTIVRHGKLLKYVAMPKFLSSTNVSSYASLYCNELKSCIFSLTYSGRVLNVSDLDNVLSNTVAYQSCLLPVDAFPIKALGGCVYGITTSNSPRNGLYVTMNISIRIAELHEPYPQGRIHLNDFCQPLTLYFTHHNTKSRLCSNSVNFDHFLDVFLGYINRVKNYFDKIKFNQIFLRYNQAVIDQLLTNKTRQMLFKSAAILPSGRTPTLRYNDKVYQTKWFSGNSIDDGINRVFYDLILTPFLSSDQNTVVDNMFQSQLNGSSLNAESWSMRHFLSMTEVLSLISTCGIVHLDLHTENILFRSDDPAFFKGLHPRLIDWDFVQRKAAFTKGFETQLGDPYLPPVFWEKSIPQNFSLLAHSRAGSPFDSRRGSLSSEGGAPLKNDDFNHREFDWFYLIPALVHRLGFELPTFQGSTIEDTIRTHVQYYKRCFGDLIDGILYIVFSSVTLNSRILEKIDCGMKLFHDAQLQSNYAFLTCIQSLLSVFLNKKFESTKQCVDFYSDYVKHNSIPALSGKTNHPSIIINVNNSMELQSFMDESYYLNPSIVGVTVNADLLSFFEQYDDWNYLSVYVDFSELRQLSLDTITSFKRNARCILCTSIEAEALLDLSKDDLNKLDELLEPAYQYGCKSDLMVKLHYKDLETMEILDNILKERFSDIRIVTILMNFRSKTAFRTVVPLFERFNNLQYCFKMTHLERVCHILSTHFYNTGLRMFYLNYKNNLSTSVSNLNTVFIEKDSISSVLNISDFHSHVVHY
ncbi:hypothetical protein PCE1_003688 [Barthelona sp. PCE]